MANIPPKQSATNQRQPRMSQQQAQQQVQRPAQPVKAKRAAKVRKPQNVRLSSRQSARQYATVHRIDPWSVLKYSLILNFALVLVLMVALALLWAFIEQLGLLDTVMAALAKVELVFEPRIGNIGRGIFLLGVMNAIIMSAVNVFLTFLYNLISDLMGGFRVELAADN